MGAALLTRFCQGLSATSISILLTVSFGLDISVLSWLGAAFATDIRSYSDWIIFGSGVHTLFCYMINSLLHAPWVDPAGLFTRLTVLRAHLLILGINLLTSFTLGMYSIVGEFSMEESPCGTSTDGPSIIARGACTPRLDIFSRLGLICINIAIWAYRGWELYAVYHTIAILRAAERLQKSVDKLRKLLDTL